MFLLVGSHPLSHENPNNLGRNQSLHKSRSQRNLPLGEARVGLRRLNLHHSFSAHRLVEKFLVHSMRKRRMKKRRRSNAMRCLRSPPRNELHGGLLERDSPALASNLVTTTTKVDADYVDPRDSHRWTTRQIRKRNLPKKALVDGQLANAKRHSNSIVRHAINMYI